ncbi:ankyrin repeat-containing domain protein [Cercophora samala]|uniref:Ankyrin repeat-containing domain protein n=1 Tax=Cercophora samala TaxID=330535 RepID=A0AA40DF73_9PEZI|nr:ankyrin repeat-containing domain protein [Cercophora samala]
MEKQAKSLAAEMPPDIALEISKCFTTAQQYNTFASLSRGFYNLINRHLYRFNVTRQRSNAREWACKNARLGTLQHLKNQGATDFHDKLVGFCMTGKGHQDQKIAVLSFLFANGVDANCCLRDVHLTYRGLNWERWHRDCDRWKIGCDLPLCRMKITSGARRPLAWKPLSLAIARGETELAIWLMQHGASIWKCCPQGSNLTALHLAVHEGNLTLVRYILDRHLEDVNSLDQRCITPWVCALHSKAEHRPMIQLLLERGVSLKHTLDKSSPILYAVHHGKFAEAFQLLDALTGVELGDPLKCEQLRYTDFQRSKAEYLCGMFEVRFSDSPIARPLHILGLLPAWLSEKEALITRLTKLPSVEPGWGDVVLERALEYWPRISPRILSYILENISPQKSQASPVNRWRGPYRVEMDHCLGKLLGAHDIRIWDDVLPLRKWPNFVLRPVRTKGTASTGATTTTTAIRHESGKDVALNEAVADIPWYNMLFQTFGDMVKILLDHGDGLKLDTPIMDRNGYLLGFFLTKAPKCELGHSSSYEGWFAQLLLEEATEKNWSGRKKEAMGHALRMAIKSGRRETAKVLQEYGAKEGIISHIGRSYLGI